MATVIGFENGRAGKDRDLGKASMDMAGEKGLAQLLSGDVIPRLLVAHARPSRPRRFAGASVSREEVTRFAPLAIHCEAGDLLDRVDEIMKRGIEVEQIFVELLAPAARLLGELWEDDRYDFLEVTMGLWRLQEVLREISSRTPRAYGGNSPRTAVFTPMPGDLHSFGPAMVQECFALAGWSADLLVSASHQEIVGTLADRHVDLLGLTLSHDTHIERAASLIRAIRSVSMNPYISIMVGGRVIADQPGLATLVGADGTADTAAGAVMVAERLVCAARLAASA